MDILCLFIQRSERYSGQYGPELYAAADQYTDDENHEYLLDQERQVQEMERAGEVSCHRIITITIDDKQLERELFGTAIKGTIKECDNG